VAEQLLHRLRVGPGDDQAGGERPPQAVQVDMLKQPAW
jgi:hypothetical protein